MDPLEPLRIFSLIVQKVGHGRTATLHDQDIVTEWLG